LVLVRVLAFGTYDADVHPRVAVLIEGLREHGHVVVEANEPLKLSTAQRVATLRQPWRLPVLVGRLGQSWWRLVRAARTEPPPDVVLVGFLGHFDVMLARLLFRGVPIVLDLLVSAEETAIDRAVTSGAMLNGLRWLDRAAIGSADVIVVDTDEHRALVRPQRRGDTVVVPVGAPDLWFLDARDVGGPPLRVVFFGLFTPLQGAPIVGAALRLVADHPIEITMIGRGQDYEETVAAAGDRARVTWVDWVEPDDLPGVVATHDVCLGIFGTGPKARSVVPNKVFQGMAAGLAVVTSDTPPQRRLLGDAAVFVPPGDAAALAGALRALAEDPARVSALRKAAAAHARETMTPVAVTASLAERLASLPSPEPSASLQRTPAGWRRALSTGRARAIGRRRSDDPS
jgi:glycosyltransferase involved in cell wall biosynthesis